MAARAAPGAKWAQSHPAHPAWGPSTRSGDGSITARRLPRQNLFLTSYSVVATSSPGRAPSTNPTPSEVRAMPSPVGASFSMRTCRAPLKAGSTAAARASPGRCGASGPWSSSRAWADPCGRPRPRAGRQPRRRARRAPRRAGQRKVPLPVSGPGAQGILRSPRPSPRTPGDGRPRPGPTRAGRRDRAAARGWLRERSRGPPGPPSRRSRLRRPGALPARGLRAPLPGPEHGVPAVRERVDSADFLAIFATGEGLVDSGLDGLEGHAEGAPFPEQREIRRREQERSAAPSDERGLGGLVVRLILRGCAHRSDAGLSA